MAYTHMHSTNLEEDLHPLARLRKASNLTQLQLAQALGVSVQSISNWENWSSTPHLTIHQTRRLVSALGKSLEYISEIIPEEVDGN
jgi:transcriptional regulator with XRE-family HTH domain